MVRWSGAGTEPLTENQVTPDILSVDHSAGEHLGSCLWRVGVFETFACQSNRLPSTKSQSFCLGRSSQKRLYTCHDIFIIPVCLSVYIVVKQILVPT